MVGVNRVGEATGLVYSGDTSVFDPFGDELYHVEHKVEVHTQELFKTRVEEVRKAIPYLKDRDVFEIKLG